MIGVSVSRDKFTSNLGPKVAQAQRERLEDAMGKGHAFSLEVAPEDRGKLKQAMFNPEWRGDELVYGTTVAYAEAKEKGTGPYLAPFQPLEEWAERVGADDPFGLARYVWRKIAREGQEAQPYLRPGLNVAERHLKSHSLNDYLDI